MIEIMLFLRDAFTYIQHLLDGLQVETLLMVAVPRVSQSQHLLSGLGTETLRSLLLHTTPARRFTSRDGSQGNHCILL